MSVGHSAAVWEVHRDRYFGGGDVCARGINKSHEVTSGSSVKDGGVRSFGRGGNRSARRVKRNLFFKT